MMTYDKTALEEFIPFLSDISNRQTILFNWSQKYLKPLNGKSLERACSDLIDFVFKHRKDYKGEILIDSVYWAGATKPTKNVITYALKDWMMSIIVYNECKHIVFNEHGDTVWDFSLKEERFIQKDSEFSKTQPKRIIKESGMTVEQKNTVFDGIVAGYLDVPELKKEEPVKKVAKKTAKKKAKVSKE